MAASAGHGKMWSHAYSVTPSGIYVPPESPIQPPGDLAHVPVTVGYHSGSHFSTLQGMENFLNRDEIKLHFAGLLLDRLALLVDRQVPAASLFGAPFYVAEQLGFRKIVDTTFMIGHLVTGDAQLQDVERYFKALRRAQQDIDMEARAVQTLFFERTAGAISPVGRYSSFGPGERLVFEPYPREVFERTRKWIESWKLFRPEQKGNAGYEASVV